MKYVYFMRAADGEGPIKIGATYRLMERLYNLQHKHDKKLVLLAFAEGSHEIENRIHRGFRAYRVEGEWFEPCEELLTYIHSVIRTGNLPEPPEDARTAQMAKLYRSGATLQQVGELFGMTRERVRQLLKLDGYESLGRREQHKRGNILVNRINHEEFAIDYRAGVTLDGLALKYGCSKATVRKLARTLGMPTRDAGRPFDRHDLAAKVADMYRRGVKVREIAQNLSLQSVNDAYRLLHHTGVTPSRIKRVAQ